MKSTQTISFITCVNNDREYNRAISYIQKLHRPKEFITETISIRGASSITEGYNLGMKLAKGKYKIFMHQDVWIINLFFIENILKIFVNNPSVGMIGVIGAKELSSSGIWWESDYQLGKVVDSHTGKFELIDCSFKSEEACCSQECQFECVEVVDGLLMATQYDIGWRVDLFDGWHFYDISQCYEFRNNNYDIVIPKQEEPWCIHDCGIVDLKDYEGYRKKFINEYM